MMTVLKLAFITALLLTTPGCLYMNFSESDFKQELTLQDLEGIYKNRAERKGEEIDIFLSKLIWPEDSVLDHRTISSIEVRKLGNHVLLVKAWDADALVKSSEYLEGEDFNIEEGRIKLGLGGGANIAPEAGAVAIHYERIELGLDRSGHGRYQSSGITTGVAMVIFPVMAAGIEDARFVRLK